MKLDCRYCRNETCTCGGSRRVTHVTTDGEVTIECGRCKTKWLHYHRREGNRFKGRARP